MFGVAPICQALSANDMQIAPRTFHAWAKRAPSKRALWDMTIVEVLSGYHQLNARGRKKPESMYGAVKMWAHLRREGIEVARCTVERLMREHGWRGLTRGGRAPKTTVSDPDAARAPDLVKRQFLPAAPNVLFVADFTYVALFGGGFAYTAFVIDGFAGLIVGWECSLLKKQDFMIRAIRQAGSFQRRQGHALKGKPIHHSDAGSQYTAFHFGEALFLEGMMPSIGTVGDAYDNALAETTIGLYKAECIRDDSPFRYGPLMTLADVEQVTSEWVDWYNNRRIMHRLGLRTPAEHEAAYYDQSSPSTPLGHK